MPGLKITLNAKGLKNDRNLLFEASLHQYTDKRRTVIRDTLIGN